MTMTLKRMLKTMRWTLEWFHNCNLALNQTEKSKSPDENLVGVMAPLSQVAVVFAFCAVESMLLCKLYAKHFTATEPETAHVPLAYTYRLHYHFTSLYIHTETSEHMCAANHSQPKNTTHRHLTGLIREQNTHILWFADAQGREGPDSKLKLWHTQTSGIHR